jgi:hypothetical protein
MPRREVGRTLLSSQREGFLVVRRGPLLAPTAFNAGKGEESGDASFVNNTIKGSLICQNNVRAPMSSGITAECIQGQCAA